MNYYKRLKSILENVLNVTDLEVTPELSATDVEKWDSLNHVRFIVAVEKAFRVKFSVTEVSGLHNIGDMVTLLEKKTGLPLTAED